jgi:hypothetical protein
MELGEQAAHGLKFYGIWFCSLHPGSRSSRSANQPIDQRAEKMQKDDHQHPDDFFRAAQAWIRDGINQHANPKNKECYGNQCEKQD